ncbi:hypothetical protein DMX06_03360 [Pseudomonas mosselii]|nr:hypothetical protein DMX06_03360 [Pseudomonas mosselii]
MSTAACAPSSWTWPPSCAWPTSWQNSKPDIACTGLFAGKPAPTVTACDSCGSGFTREEAGTDNNDLKPHPAGPPPSQWPRLRYCVSSPKALACPTPAIRSTSAS